ncbi:DUF4157 domain-containing protein [Sphingomonas parva]|uniref:DUF4157 domain-containing protein n=1 Tax=Sphingomonas parva TaxID=2555898 RepID=UPI001CDB7860|nr:DUF4157 domain-containing protein [Sphingomonas parva]
MIGLLSLSSDVRRRLGIKPNHPGYEWLRDELERAQLLSRSAAAESRVQTNAAAAQILEQAIRYSRSNARRSGTREIPSNVKMALAAHFPESILDETRWRLAGSDLTLGSAVAAWYGREGGAVALVDTIIFSDQRMAGNLVLWAHELTHALQYEELGLREFARLYVSGHALLERQAWQNAYRIGAVLQQQRQAASKRKFTACDRSNLPARGIERPLTVRAELLSLRAGRGSRANTGCLSGARELSKAAVPRALLDRELPGTPWPTSAEEQPDEFVVRAKIASYPRLQVTRSPRNLARS